MSITGKFIISSIIYPYLLAKQMENNSECHLLLFPGQRQKSGDLVSRPVLATNRLGDLR